MCRGGGVYCVVVSSTWYQIQVNLNDHKESTQISQGDRVVELGRGGGG